MPGAVLIMVGAFFPYSLAATGSWKTGYNANMSTHSMIGFGGGTSVAPGLLNDQAQLSSLIPILDGWPLIVGLSMVRLLFVLGSRSCWDLWFLLAALFAIGVYTTFESSGLMYGRRYWYEATPFLLLLTARGFVLLKERLPQWSELLLRRRTVEPPLAISGAASYGFLAVLLIIGIHGWMLGKHFNAPPNDFQPRSIAETKGFNGIDNRLIGKVNEMDLHNALVFVKECSGWQCYCSVFWNNDVDFNGDIVYARDLLEMATIARYPNRQVYLADYGADTIVPYDPFPIRPDAPGA